MKQRLIKMFGVQAFNQLTLILEKLIVPPIIIANFGMTGFGEWTLIRAIPMYFQLLDLGFFTIAGNKIVNYKLNKDKLSVNMTLANLMLFYLTLVLIILLVIAGIFYLDISEYVFDRKDNYYDLCLSLSFLYVGLYLGSQFYFSILRGVIKHVEASFTTTVFRFFEVVVTVFMLVMGQKFLVILFCMVVVRFANLLALHRILKRHCKINFLKALNYYDWSVFKLDIREGMSSCVFSLSQLYSSQVVLVYIGLFMNTAFVGYFQTLKIVSGLLIQVAGVINRTFLSEFSILFSKGEFNKAKNVLNRTMFFSTIFSLIFIISIFLFSHYIFNFWLGENFEIDEIMLSLMCFTSSLYLIWYTMSTALIASNKHGDLSKSILVNCIIFTMLSYYSISCYGLYGIVLSVVIFEIFNFILATYHSISFWKVNV
ncbi:lipopolysaccharide biosynthesis protein [Vibrio parahaemolyticus]|uniref:lipopolysaccharide biosynthesis protein n=1 Tax=Vibrio TaxID=662 RepID=UPI00146A4880|nr:lipopolysaccharide biosynthesis protein [Vibrio parahaemolyticus]MDF5680381.1 lipopolysaccharide biosynthesis protein [Vibrio parahaemolyticus]NMU10767.1 lipopolysaccharide biosynthesis protein [Vibrio parahaemolyticus]